MRPSFMLLPNDMVCLSWCSLNSTLFCHLASDALPSVLLLCAKHQASMEELTTPEAGLPLLTPRTTSRTFDLSAAELAAWTDADAGDVLPAHFLVFATHVFDAPRPHRTDIRTRLVCMYRFYAPEKLPDVEAVLVKYKDSQAQLLASAVKKYGPEPHDVLERYP